MDRLRYLLGVLTLAVMAGSGYLLYRTLKTADLADRYRFEVSFQSARGLRVGADVKYRGIAVGSVRRIDVSQDGDQAVLLLTVLPEQRGLVRGNSSFWIVVPRFHGLAGGISGLDTLVRDAYVAFATPDPPGEPVAAGSRLQGTEAPMSGILPKVQHGDLLMRVLLPQNHGLTEGASVLFRGMATGEVRSIELAESGSHVEVRVRIAARYRATVTDKSVFWVGQPRVNLRLSISSPLSVDEVESLLRPFLAYYTPPKTGVPVHDDYAVAAFLEPPDIAVSEVPASALLNAPGPDAAERGGPVAVVRVVYEAVDVDYLSLNDQLRREGTGILFLDAKGRSLVMTPRSVCDAGYYYSETFGERARIRGEKLAVVLADGRALTATRTWIDESGADLAVLLVEGLPRAYPTTEAPAMQFVPPADVPAVPLELLVADERGTKTRMPFVPGKVDLATSRGGAVVQGDRLVGCVGQAADRDETPAVIALSRLPESLRPAQ